MGTSTALSQWLAIWSFQSIVHLFFHSLYPFPWRAIPAFRNHNGWGRFQQYPTVFVSFKDIKFYQIVCHLLTTVPNIKHSLKLISTFSYLYYSLIHVMRSPCNMISLTVTTLSPSKILLSLGETRTHTQISVHLHYNPLQSFHQKSLGLSANIWTDRCLPILFLLKRHFIQFENVFRKHTAHVSIQFLFYISWWQNPKLLGLEKKSCISTKYFWQSRFFCGPASIEMWLQ